jgi:hypothetical protein
LNDVETWMEKTMRPGPKIEELTPMYIAWSRQRALSQGVEPALLDAYQAANPAFMSAAGIQRYWKKNRVVHRYNSF